MPKPTIYYQYRVFVMFKKRLYRKVDLILQNPPSQIYSFLEGVGAGVDIALPCDDNDEGKAATISNVLGHIAYSGDFHVPLRRQRRIAWNVEESMPFLLSGRLKKPLGPKE